MALVVDVLRDAGADWTDDRPDRRRDRAGHVHRTADRRRHRAGAGPRARTSRSSGCPRCTPWRAAVPTRGAGRRGRRHGRDRRAARRGVRRRVGDVGGAPRPAGRAAAEPRRAGARRRWPRSMRARRPQLAGGGGRGGRIQGGSRALGSPDPRAETQSATESARSSIAGWRRGLRRRPRRRSARSICVCPTPRSPSVPPGSHDIRQLHDSISRLLRPSAGHRHRAPRVHHAVVAGHVRAGAVQAVGGVPGGR